MYYRRPASEMIKEDHGEKRDERGGCLHNISYLIANHFAVLFMIFKEVQFNKKCSILGMTY